jgi:hypothetical protein
VLNHPSNRRRESKLWSSFGVFNRLAGNQEIPAASGRVEVL